MQSKNDINNIHIITWSSFRLSNQLQGHYSLCYFVHWRHNNAWYKQDHSLIWKLYFVIMASNNTHIPTHSWALLEVSVNKIASWKNIRVHDLTAEFAIIASNESKYVMMLYSDVALGRVLCTETITISPRKPLNLWIFYLRDNNNVHRIYQFESVWDFPEMLKFAHSSST